MAKISSFLNRISRKIKIIFHVPAKTNLKTDQTKWQNNAQSGELKFHVTNDWRNTPAFMEQTIKLFDNFGFNRKVFDQKTIIDLGAGSKLRSKYFMNTNIIVIEPLADEFIKNIEWCDLTDAKKVFSKPAEEKLTECIQSADFIMSINVLDHCFDFEKIIANVYDYLKDDGVAFLSFDKHDYPDEMHPLTLTEQTCEEIFERNGFFVEKFSTGAGDIFATYGHGSYCLNYWLKKKVK